MNAPVLKNKPSARIAGVSIEQPDEGVAFVLPQRRLPPSATPLSRIYRYLATSDAFVAKSLRVSRRRLGRASIPAPKPIMTPLLWSFVLCRKLYHAGLRIFICEPLFKTYCRRYGRGLHTGCYIPWIQGKGSIIVGDEVRLGGKCTITFASRFSNEPLLIIGDGTGIGHACEFVVGKRIMIGRNCQLSGEIWIGDSNGHSSDLEKRRRRLPPDGEDVRPVTIGDGVWIGKRAMIFPGVRVGQGSVISAGSVVHSHVPPFSIVAGNPAKVVMRLRRAQADGEHRRDPHA